MNFDNVITEIPATRSACPSVYVVCSKWDVLNKKSIVAILLLKQGKGKKKLWQCIVKIGEEKKIMVTEIQRGIKKISVTSIIFLQHFHNKSHVISYYQFKFEFNTGITFFNLTIATCHLKFVVKIEYTYYFLKKKKVEWNCGNGIAKIVGEKNLQLVCGNAIAEMGGKKNWSCEKWNGIRQCHCHNSIPHFFFFFF